jgi:hypothetical protein
MDTIKGLALIGLHWRSRHLRHVGVAMGECVASLSRTHPWRDLLYSTQSPWPFALPPLIMDVVAVGGVQADLKVPTSHDGIRNPDRLSHSQGRRVAGHSSARRGVAGIEQSSEFVIGNPALYPCTFFSTIKLNTRSVTGQIATQIPSRSA